MSVPGRNVIENLREPEYTGENRCVPCTLVNAVIAGLLSLLVGVVFAPLGLLVLVGSAGLIYLRGYVVPGTPELTRRYLPDRIQRQFGEHPAVRTTDTSETVEDVEDGDSEETDWETLDRIEYERNHSVDPAAYLADVGAIEPGREDRVLQPTFAESVQERVEHYRSAAVDPEQIADIFGVDGEGLAFEDRDYPAIKIDLRIRKWPSEAALIADAATHDVLAERSDEWLDVPREQRVEILETLRTYRDVCPDCGGELAFHDDTFESCCGRYEVAIYGCLDCEAHILELDPSLVDKDPKSTGIVPDLDQH